MTLSELIDAIARQQTDLNAGDTALAVKALVTCMRDSLAQGERIEIRGFGAFELRLYPARTARNPRTGEPVGLSTRVRPRFKPGKELRERVDAGMNADSGA